MKVDHGNLWDPQPFQLVPETILSSMPEGYRPRRRRQSSLSQ